MALRGLSFHDRTPGAGVIHLFSAVTSLWTLAKYLEQRHCVFAPGLTLPLLFLLSGVAGCLLSVNLAFEHDAAGATAGVCGLLGESRRPSYELKNDSLKMLRPAE